MSINIIRPGTKSTTKCNTCGCFFAFEEEDLEQVVKIEERTSGNITCPQCSDKKRVSFELPFVTTLINAQGQKKVVVAKYDR